VALAGASIADEAAVYRLTLGDGLANDVYDCPLTFCLSIPAASGWVFSHLATASGEEVETVPLEEGLRFDLVPDELACAVHLVRD
jgi:hypothetical protein